MQAICTLVRFLEVSPKAPVPWVLYLLLYRGADGAQGSSPSHVHNLCRTAVRPRTCPPDSGLSLQLPPQRVALWHWWGG